MLQKNKGKWSSATTPHEQSTHLSSIAGLMGQNSGHWIKLQIRPDMLSKDVLIVYS